MGVHVDEPRSDDKPGHIDNCIGRRAFQRSDRNDAAVAEPHIALEARCTGSVYNSAANQQRVVARKVVHTLIHLRRRSARRR